MIKILTYVYGVLSESQAIIDLVGDDIFPNIVPDKNTTGKNVTLPHIVMYRRGIDPTYTKMKGCNQDSATVDIDVWSDDYDQALDTLEAVRDALEFSSGDIGVKVSKSRVVSADEGFADGSYFQRLTFNFK